MSYFRMSSISPAKEFAGTIQVRKPIRSLGPVTDIHGQKWDIHGIFGKHVSACKESELHPYFTDTSSNPCYGLVSQKWEPYKVEVVE